MHAINSSTKDVNSLEIKRLAVADVITRAYYEANVIASEFESPTGAQLNDALYWFNSAVSYAFSRNLLSAYENHQTLVLTPGVSEYDLPLVTEIRQATFMLGNVRFDMILDTQATFFGSLRVMDIRSLPFHYYFEKKLGGGKIYLYFIPDQAYPLNLTVKSAYPLFAFEDNLLETFDLFFIDYLTHLLAFRICLQWGQQVPEGLNTLLRLSEKTIRELTPIRLEGVSSSIFKGPTSMDDPFFYSYYHGWWP